MAQTARTAVVMLAAALLAVLAGCTRERPIERPVLPSASPTATPVPTPTTSPLPAPGATPDASALPSPTLLPSPSPAPTGPPTPELACVAVMNHCSCKFICIPASDRTRTDCARACPQERTVIPPKCSGQSGKCAIVP